MSEAKTSNAQLKAADNYRNKALDKISPIIISQKERDVFDALNALQAHYGDNRSKAVKQALLAHAKELGLI